MILCMYILYIQGVFSFMLLQFPPKVSKIENNISNKNIFLFNTIYDNLEFFYFNLFLRVVLELTFETQIKLPTFFQEPGRAIF